MRWTESLKYLAGSIVVYYVMAACSSPAPSASTAPGASSGGTASGGTSGGAVSSSGSGPGATSSSGAASSGGWGNPVPDANADTSQSGSRLKATYYVGADGSRQFAYFADSARGGEQCSFVVASDGATRCMPISAASFMSGSYFSDASCTQPLAVAEAGCAAPRYLYSAQLASGCGGYTSYALYSVGGAFSGTTYVKSGTTCTAATLGSFAVYAPGAEITAASFEQATLQAE